MAKKPMTDKELDAFIGAAADELDRKQEALATDYGMGTYKRWFFDQETEKLQFFGADDALRLEADVVEIGSYNSNSDTWMWAWSNDTVLPKLREKAAVLKELADITGVDIFAEEVLAFKEGSEALVRDLVAVSVRHLNAHGFYSAPSPSKPLTSYLAITRLKVVTPTAPADPPGLDPPPKRIEKPRWP